MKIFSPLSLKEKIAVCVIIGSTALLAILVSMFNLIPVGPNDQIAKPNQPELKETRTEKSTPETLHLSKDSKATPVTANKTSKPSNADQKNEASQISNTQKPQLTRKQLTARALVVEKQANKRLDELTEKLNLTEEQQDFIFPILAKSLPTFHPSLNPDGNNLLNGIKTRVEPGSPVPDVEAEIYSILDDDQKMILEEEALDREAWWDDVVALLDSDSKLNSEKAISALESSKQPPDNPNEPSQKEREEKAAKNKIDDFSSLLRNN